MKTKIKRHSRSVISVLLAVCMLVSCMTAGMIMTDAAKVDSGTVGGSDNTITDYFFKGSFDSWTPHYVNSSGEAFVNISTPGTYEFVVITGGGTQKCDNHTFTRSATSYNTTHKTPNFKITADVAGTYTFKTSTVDSGGSIRVTLTFPSSGDSTSTDWRLVDGDCGWTPANSTKKFTLNSATGYYEYSQYFTGNNYFRVYDGTSQYNGNGGSSNVTLTAGADFVNLGNATTSNSFAFTPSPAGTYIVQIDATNKKIRIQQARQYTVTCQTPTNGTLTSSVANAYAGDTVTLTVTPDAGYAFKSLVLTYDDNGHDVTSQMNGNTYTFTMPAFNVTAAATFTNSKTIYYNNYETQWSKVYVYSSLGSGATLTEGNGPSPGQEMTRIGTTCIYYAEVPSDMGNIVFYGSGGENNRGATITCGGNTDFGNKMPPSAYNEYKSTNAAATTGEWSTHSDRNNYYTVTPGTSITGNTTNNLYYNGLNATLYDYYTDGEYNSGNANWINGIKDKSGSQLAEYCLSNGSDYSWNPYRTLNTALSTYASQNGVTYPLYFGNLNIRDSNTGNVYQGDLGTGSYTNWYYKINNSTNLSPNTSSITGLAAAAEGSSSINHTGGAAMAMFDEDWLSQENATKKPLATILHSSAFPVRKVDEAAGTTYNKIYASLPSNLWGAANPVIFAHFFDSSSHTNDVMMTYNSSSGYYEATIPTDYNYTKVIFVRDKTGTSSIAWSGGNFWNQSDEFNLPSSKTDPSRLYTNTANGNGNVFTKGNIASSYGITSSKPYTYYEYDSTNGTDNAFIKNVNTNNHTATIEYSTTDKVYSSGIGGNGAQPGFYPFDNMDGNITNQNVGTSKVAHDLGYGMKLEIPFSLNENRTLDGTTTGSAQTFNFSGDDDLWVYIDGHLVLDLGGAHFKAEGSIDFKTMTATSTTKVVAAEDAKSNATSDLVATETYSNDFSDWFEINPNALHHMTLYYMERGMYDSNLKFDFSFHAIQNLYKTEKKVRTNSINQGFYEVDATTRYPGTNITKFEQSYQDEEFNVDHKISSDRDGTYGYPTESFKYAKVHNKATSTATYTAGDGKTLDYTLMNDDVAQFNGKFKTGDFFQLTETAASDNKYSYTPTLTVYDDANKTKRTDVTNAGANAFRFQFHEPDPSGLKTVNIRAQLENIMKQHDLKITKSIGEREDPNTEFTFRITFNFDYEGTGDDNGYEGYPLFISSDKDNTKTQLYAINQANGFFKIKAGETITIPRIPEGADFRIEEIMTGIDTYTYGGMSAVGATATPVSGENAVTMTMGESNINVTAMNNDNTVKGTIRVKYAPSYYDFEQGTNISQDTYTNTNGSYTNPAVVTKCETSFTDSAASSTVISEQTMVETDTRDANKSFAVSVDKINDGGKLFIGWYDGAGNRYHDDDATQHEFTASAPKDQDRIFEARFITAPTYRLDFKVPTRLWGERIYKVFGKVKNSMISDNYIGYDSTRDDGQSVASSQRRYYLTGKFVHDNTPHESIFLQTVDWPEIDEGITSTEYKVSKTVTTNIAPTINVEETETGTNVYDLYRKIEATTDDQKVTVQIFSDCDHPDTAQVVERVPYGSPINNYATVATNIPEGKTFYRWRIETLDSLGEEISNTQDETLVTYDYSKNFNYVAYDNYKVTVEYIDKIGVKDYNPYSAKNEDDPYHAQYAPTNTSSVIVLGQTRSHWNDTESGVKYVPDDEESPNHLYANNDVDRLILDLGLSYSENEIKLNTEDNLQVGFIIEYQKSDGTWQKWKEVNFSSKLLGEKNRIEYYYDLKNAPANRSAKFKVWPTIRGEKNGTSAEFNFDFPIFSAQT